ncbi:MAG TPA: Ig-like domain-containing protein [Kofleriaceae bacterium]|nr:Ig-like domain-containing protein [Kofleriaceae bacterium]
MLVNRPRLSTQGAVVTAVAVLALSACSDPTARTDLRPEGPPDVLAVLVLNDALGGLVESATYCKPGDEKRPGLVGLPDFTTTQICPDVLSEGVKEIDDAAPQGWYVRIMFDELLDPNVEDLIPVPDENNQDSGVSTGTISKTKPVTLQCEDFTGAMVDVDYDGYYSPSGNNVTWPLGPSLVVKPKQPTTISVGSKCQITLKDTITDKQGERVPPDQRGPYPFKVAPVQAIAISPGDGETVDPETGGVEVTFNVDLDPASLCNNMAAPFPVSPGACVSNDPTMTDSKATFTPVATNVGVQLVANNDYVFFGDLLDNQTYSFEIPAGVMVKDHCGKVTTLAAPAVKENSKVTFKTSKLELFTVAPFGGMNIAPGKKIKIDFNQLMDPSSIDPTEFTISPAPLNQAFRQDFNGDFSVIVVNGQYALDTEYTFTLKKGSTVRDLFDTADYVLPEDIVAKFRTAPSIALTASSPANGATVTKAGPTSAVSIRLTFNQEMSPASFAPGTDYTLIDDATGQQIPVSAVNDPSNPAQIRFRSTTPAGGALTPGKYTFTFKAGASVDDKITPTPNTYAQAADRVIKFTVVEAAPGPKCLGAP